jgi:hypothetical protein
MVPRLRNRTEPAGHQRSLDTSEQPHRFLKATNPLKERPDAIFQW